MIVWDWMNASFGLVYPQSNNYLLDRMMVLASIDRVSIGSRHTHAPVKLVK
jgi:hypothetical protein